MTESPANNPYARFVANDPARRSVPEILAASPAQLTALVDAIGPQRIQVAPAPGKWTPAEILCHLADCEIAFAFRLRQALAEDHHILQPFDQEKWAATYSGIPAEQALVVFQTNRAWNLTLVKNAPPNAASRVVTHPERGAMTFATLLETMAGHDLNHILQLEKLANQQ
jgi:hypothetical protein